MLLFLLRTCVIGICFMGSMPMLMEREYMQSNWLAPSAYPYHSFGQAYCLGYNLSQTQFLVQENTLVSWWPYGSNSEKCCI